jgi:uncharacterized protein (TIGR00730 family)
MTEKKIYALKNETLNRAVRKLVADAGSDINSDLLTQMITTTLKLKDEMVDRGDLKILNTSLKELRWAFRVFRPYRHIKKVSVFGSARTKRNDPVFKAAVDFSKLMVEQNWMIVTGGSSGIMHAGNEGAGRAHSFGANIRLPLEQEVNPVVESDKKLIHFKYFFTRKLIFVKESDAICLFPGGFGTMDEGYESLTLIQTGKMMPRPIVLIDSKKGHYWKSWLRFVNTGLLKQRMIDKTDLNLFTLAKNTKHARDIILQFYKNYHSMRFVRDKLVIRLNHELSDADVKKLNRSFKDIMTKGKIEKSGPLAIESDETDAVSLPRLVLHFDRRSFGRLKILVDKINLSGD